MKCRFCDPPPTTFEGHASLVPLMPARQPASGMGFACRECGTEWVREHVGEGRFEWTRRLAGK